MSNMKSLFSIAILVILFHSNSVFSQATVQVTPQTTVVEITHQFSVDIEIGYVNNLFAFATDMNYDNTQVHPVSLTEGGLLSENGSVNTFFQYDIDEINGEITIGISRTDNTVPGVNVSSPQAAVTIVFEATGVGTGLLDLNNVGLLAPDGQTTYPATVYDGNVTVFEVTQSVSVFFDPGSYQAQLPETFLVDVVLGPVNNLMAFATEVNFDPTVITLLDIIEGDFLNENGTVPTTFMKEINNATGNCIIGVTRLTNPPSGASSTQNNTAVTLKFNTANAGNSPLTLDNTGLIHPNGVTYYTPVITDGSVHVTVDPNHAILDVLPGSVQRYPGQDFNCSVSVSDVSDLFAVSIDVIFDPDLIEAVGISEGYLLNEFGTVQTTFIYDIDNTNGVIIVGISRFAGSGGVSTTYPSELFNVMFVAKDSGNGTVNLANVGLIAPDGQTTYSYTVNPCSIDILPVAGVIQGTVTNSLNGMPVENATVWATGGFYANQPSSLNGDYIIYVPYGLGYHVFANAYGYNNIELTNVHVTASNPVAIVDISLDPLPEVYELSEMIPDPNPQISTVSQFGTVHRYYFVGFGNTNIPAENVSVEVVSTNDNFLFYSDENGIVDIAIPSNKIGGGLPGAAEIYEIVAVNNQVISPAVQFVCGVKSQEYTKYWDCYEFGKLGVSFFSVDFKRGSSVCLVENAGDVNNPDQLLITRQGRAGGGVEFSTEVGAKVTCGPITAGASASAGAGGNVAGVTEDYYEFPHQNYNDWEAMAQYILIGDGNFSTLDNTLIRFLSLLEEHFLNTTSLQDAYLGDKKGIDVGVFAEASAFVGAGSSSSPVMIGAGANIGTEGHALFNIIHHKDSDENEFNFGVSGSLAGNAGVGIKMNLNPNQKPTEHLKGYLNLVNFDGTRGMEFSIFRDNISGQFSKFELKFLHRNYTFTDGWEEVVTYTISGQDVYNAVVTLNNQVASLCNSFNSGGNFTIPNNLFSQITNGLFQTLYDLQVNNQGDATIAFQKEIKDIEHISSVKFEIKVAATKFLSVELGGGVGFEQGKTKLMESGKWVWGNHLVLEDNGSYIPEIEVSYAEVLQDVVDGVPGWVRVLMALFNWINPTDGKEIYPIGDNGSYIEIPAGAFPPGLDSIACGSWSWYGGSPAKMLSDLDPSKKGIFMKNKAKAEESFGMRYGIGGFYQFEPIDVSFADTCYITIMYQDTSVVDIDESTLGLYREDKSSHRWIYIGGIVDTLNNQVTCPITQLALYTLAPAMPYGRFGLIPSADSIYADSLSYMTITSTVIFNNDSTPVFDGQMFTINTESGTITAQDMDPNTEGIQIESLNGQISFDIISSPYSARPEVSALSLSGSATADTAIYFYDTIPPIQPVGLSGILGDESVHLRWTPNSENDIAGYRIYFDSDGPNPPYTGVASVYGLPSPITMGQDTNFTVTGLFNDTSYCFAVTAFDIAGNESTYSAPVCFVPSANISLDLTVFLEGPFDNGTMLTAMNDIDLLPLTQPYNTAPWNYSGTEVVSLIPDPDIVDWVLVELRETSGNASTATSSTMIARKAAFLMKDGSIRDLDGNGQLEISAAISQNLYAVIWHRNHLGIMSANPLVEQNGVYTYDFSTSSYQVYGSSLATKELMLGVWGMVGGDGNSDAQVNNADKIDVWRPQAGSSGYLKADFNLNTQVNNQDKNDIWAPNSGSGGQVPDNSTGIIPDHEAGPVKTDRTVSLKYKCFVPE